MRTLTAPETTTLGLPYHDRETHTIVRVQNADGTWKTLTNLDSLNRVSSVEWTRSADQPVASGTIVVHRKDLSPLDETSSLNVDDLGAYAALLDGARRIDIQTATVQSGVTPSAGDYHSMFDGVIRKVKWPGEDWVRLEIHDRIERYLQSRPILNEITYGTKDGRAIEDVMQDMLDDWTDGRVTLWVPTSPGQQVTPTPWNNIQLLQALWRYANWIGWTLRSQWNESAGEFQLLFSEPDRTASTTDWDFALQDIFEYQNVELDVARVRNDVQVLFTNESGERINVTRTDSTSIDRYEKQTMIVEEADDSPINTKSEATTLADAILADLKDPQLHQVTRGAYFFPVQVGDYLGFAPDDRWYSSGQNLGVFSITHRLGGPDNPTGAETTLGVRGKPAGQYTRWQAWETGPDRDEGEDDYRITKLEEDSRTADTVTYSLSYGPKVHHTLVFRKDVTAPPGTNPWPGPDDLLTTLARSDTSVTFDLPATGQFGYIQLQPEGASGTRGPVRRIELRPAEKAPVAAVITFDDADGTVVVSATAPEDVAAIYINVGDGANPADPTAASHDAKITGNSDTVDTNQTVTLGNYAYLAIVTEDSDGNLDDPQYVRSQYKNVFPGQVFTASAISIQLGEGEDRIRMKPLSGAGQIVFLDDTETEELFIAAGGGTSFIGTVTGTGSEIQINSDGELVLAHNDNLFMSDLPTSDPGISGAIWVDAGTLKRSSG